MESTTVLIISDDPEFSRAIPSRWRSERHAPSFIQINSEVSLSFDPDNFQLVIIGGLKSEVLEDVLKVLEASGKRIILVAQDANTGRESHERWPRISVVSTTEAWLESVVLLGIEILGRIQAEGRAEEAERAKAVLERQATLGRYMIEMRHSLNNALTSVLGNCELLLLEPGSLSAQGMAQMETVRNMALRIHEIMQRFSSLEKELSVAERHSIPEAKPAAHAAVM